MKDASYTLGNEFFYKIQAQRMLSIPALSALQWLWAADQPEQAFKQIHLFF